MGGRATDFVAMMNHSELEDWQEAVFTEHVNRSDKKIFSIRNKTPSDVKQVGTEQNPGDGYEYVLAVVNRRTKQVEYRPVSVLGFEARYKPSEEFLAGKSEERSVNYEVDHSVGSDERYDKRRQLTADFGSAKKIKMQDAAQRRHIGDQTLDAMTSTTFASPSKLGVVDTKIDEKGLPSVSLVNDPQSMVLPAANAGAEMPAQVYNWRQFVSKDDEIELQDVAAEYFGQFDTAEKLIQSGVPPVAAKRVGSVMKRPDAAFLSVAALKMITMAKLAKLCFKSTGGRGIPLEELHELGLPDAAVTHIRVAFFGTSTSMSAGKAKFTYSLLERDKLLAHCLCMMLLFEEPEFALPVSGLTQDLGVPEKSIRKLLEGLGCMLVTASTEQQQRLNTIQIARLLGPPQKAKKGRFSRGRKSR
ncbi:Protein RPOA-49 [Aphelenchoides avenae]|nr:Protein RPOA-49 [Aphelenchus avenae]